MSGSKVAAQSVLLKAEDGKPLPADPSKEPSGSPISSPGPRAPARARPLRSAQRPDSGGCLPGPQIGELERRFCEYIGARYAIAAGSCAAALSALLIAIGVTAGDEVILSPLYFCAAAGTIARLGAIPVFADTDTDYDINPDEIERHTTVRTRAIIATHYIGLPCRMDKILAYAHKRSLPVIEDAAQALGAIYRNRKVGAIGDAAVFRFRRELHGAPVMDGMITTDNQELAETVRALSTREPEEITPPGDSDPLFPADLPENGEARTGRPLPEFSRLDELLEIRRRYAAIYSEALHQLPGVSVPFVWSDVRHAWHMYAFALQPHSLGVDRDRFADALCGENVEARALPLPIHLQPSFRSRYEYRPGDLPVAERLSAGSIILPLDERMTERYVRGVASAVQRVVRRYSA